MRRPVAVLLLVAACGGGAPSLADTLGTLPFETGTVVSDLHTALQFGSAPEDAAEVSLIGVFGRVPGVAATARAAVLYDQAGRVEEPALSDDLDRFARFLGDLVLASGDLDVAVSGDDPVGAALSWLRIEASAGALAVRLDPVGCPAVVPTLTADLCRPDLPDGYTATVEATVRLFLARYRPVMRMPAAFDEVTLGEVAAVVAPEVIDSIDSALDDLTAAEPPPIQQAMHSVFVDHLTALRLVWSEVVAGTIPALPVVDTAAADAPVRMSIWSTLAARLEGAACDGADDFLAARARLRIDDPASTIPDLGVGWFYGEGIGCP